MEQRGERPTLDLGQDSQSEIDGSNSLNRTRSSELGWHPQFYKVRKFLSKPVSLGPPSPGRPSARVATVCPDVGCPEDGWRGGFLFCVRGGALSRIRMVFVLRVVVCVVSSDTPSGSRMLQSGCFGWAFFRNRTCPCVWLLNNALEHHKWRLRFES